eukprot:scaffold80129_cov57-Phaeocystis_antarctica.AAC.4
MAGSKGPRPCSEGRTGTAAVEASASRRSSSLGCSGRSSRSMPPANIWGLRFNWEGEDSSGRQMPACHTEGRGSLPNGLQDALSVAFRHESPCVVVTFRVF